MKALLKIIMFLIIGQFVCLFSLFSQENITIVDSNSSKKTTSDSVVFLPFGSAVRKDTLKVPSSKTVSEVLKGTGLISYQSTGESRKDSAYFFMNCCCPPSSRTNPLILIDEVESSSEDLGRLNPDDIVSFSIIKDAAAFLMFGTRGTNGVIRIITKLCSKDVIKPEKDTSSSETDNQFVD